MHQITVSKFGGTSLRDGATIEHVIDNIILQDKKRKVIVASAPGTLGSETKITNLLIKSATNIYEGATNIEDELRVISSRFYQISDHLKIPRPYLDEVLGELFAAATEVKKRGESGEVLPSYQMHRDSIISFGEIINASILAQALRQKGVDATLVRPEQIGMHVGGKFGDAKLLPKSYSSMAAALKPLLSEGKTIVFPGFYGVTEEGSRMTFSRGGSDITGSILANASDSALYENWTDRNGILRADPSIVPHARTIERLSYDHAREIAASGATVLHPDTLEPLIEKNIPLQVRNTFDLNNSGTLISFDLDDSGTLISSEKKRRASKVEGVLKKDGFTTLSFKLPTDHNLASSYGFIARVFADNDLSIEQFFGLRDEIELAVPSGGKERVLSDVISRLQKYSPNIRTGNDRSLIHIVSSPKYSPIYKDIIQMNISENDNYATIHLRKLGMNEQVGYLRRLFDAVEESKIPMLGITTSIDSVAFSVYLKESQSHDPRKKLDTLLNTLRTQGLSDTQRVYGREMFFPDSSAEQIKKKMNGAKNLLDDLGIMPGIVVKALPEGTTIFSVPKDQANTAVRSIHDHYFPGAQKIQRNY